MRHYGQGHGDGALKLSSPRLQGLEDSDDEEGEEDEGQLEQEHEQQAPTTTGIPTTQEGGGGGEGATPRPLQRVAGQTARTARRQLHRGAEIEQAEQAHQSLVSKGATLAGVVVGGVVIGALTAGVGLVPYLGLVGTAAVVSGGAVAYTAAQAPGSRVVLAAETEVSGELG